MDVPTLVQGFGTFRRFVKDRAKRLGFSNISFTAVLGFLPQTQEVDRRHEDGLRLFAYLATDRSYALRSNRQRKSSSYRLA